jgi:hypothetical protein
MSGLEGYTLSRRDDLESLGYSIMYLIDADRIPWKINNNKKDILVTKKEFSTALAVHTKYIGIRDFINEAAATGYTAEPDYDKFKEILLNMMRPHEDIVKKHIQDLASNFH